MKMAPWTAPLLLTALALAGCTGGGGGDSDYTTPDQDDQGRYVVRMTSDFKFIPEKASVPVGATVVWVNEGGAHNVVPDGHAQWRASTVSGDKGEHLEVTLGEAGTFDYFCQPHKSLGMVGTVKVG